MPSRLDHGGFNVPLNSANLSAEQNRNASMAREDASLFRKFLFTATALVYAGLGVSVTTGLGIAVATGDGIDGAGYPIYIPATIPNTGPAVGLGTEGTAPTATLAAADPTNPRIDLVYLRAATLLTDFTSILTNDGINPTVAQPLPQTRMSYFTLGVVTGTPGASPAVPAQLLATDLVIAQVRVNAAQTTLTGGSVTDTRPMFTGLPRLNAPNIWTSAQTIAGNVGIGGAPITNGPLEAWGGTSQILFGTAADQGNLYGTTTSINLGYGNRWNGANWVARLATTTLYAGTAAGSHNWYIDTGLTIGSTYTSTQQMTLTPGALTFTNAASNLINMGLVGFGVPTFTTRSAGTKLVLYPALNASQVDFAIGLDGVGGINYSVPQATSGWFHKFYGGTTLLTTIRGDGLLDNTGTVRATGLTSPVTGSGMEMYFTAGTGYLTSVNRSASTYLPASVAGLTVALSPSGNPMGLFTPTGLNLGSGNSPLAMLDIQAGGDGNGAGSKGAIAFQYITGGYRHWVDSRHSSVAGSAFNGLDFYINNGAVGVSTIPGTGNVKAFTIDPAQVIVYGGQLALSNATSNLVNWGTAGVGAPTFTTRSVGVKNVLYPLIDATHVDIGGGVETGGQWWSVGSAVSANQFRWYGGTTPLMTLSGAALLAVNGSVTSSGSSGAGTGAFMDFSGGTTARFFGYNYGTSGVLPVLLFGSTVTFASGSFASCAILNANGTFDFTGGTANKLTFVVGAAITTNQSIFIDAINLIHSAYSTGAVYFNYFSGTGGALFCNGTSTVTASITAAGVFAGTQPTGLGTAAASGKVPVCDSTGFLPATCIPGFAAGQRNTVLQGHVNATTGIPDFITGVGATLASGAGLLATAVPHYVTFAAGFKSNGAPQDFFIANVADIASVWTGLTASATNYLYLDRNSGTSAITAGFVANVAPVIQTYAPGSDVRLASNYWGFNEASGTAVADSLGGNNGTATGTTITAGKYGNGRSFNGSSSDYVTTTLIPAVTTYTLAAWVNPNSTGTGLVQWICGDQTAAGPPYNANARIAIQFNSNAINVTIGDGTNSTQFFPAGTVPYNTLTHVFITVDGTNVKLYINGALTGTVAQTRALPGTAAGAAFTIGQGGSTRGNPFYGIVDELYIWQNVVLNATEIAAFYAAGAAPFTVPPTNKHWYDPNKAVMQYWTGSAWTAVQRVFVGTAATNGTNVTAVSSVAPGAITYAGNVNAPGNSSTSVFMANSITLGSGLVKVPIDTVEWDNQNEWDSTNKRFVAKVAGEYDVTGFLAMAIASGSYASLAVYVNGIQRKVLGGTTYNSTGTITVDIGCRATIRLAAGDYVELFTGSATSNLATSGPSYTYMQIRKVG
jgi:hypothetical protein